MVKLDGHLGDTDVGILTRLGRQVPDAPLDLRMIGEAVAIG
jgi:hypothetical protein